MNWWKSLLGVACLLLSCMWSDRARADFALQFADAAGVQVSEIPAINVGQTFDVYVYLLQTSGTLLTEDHLFSAGFHLDYRDATVAQVLSSDDVEPNSVFDFFNEITLDATGVTINLTGSDRPFGTPSDPDRLLLAGLRLTGVTGGEMNLGFDLLNSGAGFVTGQGDEFDDKVNISAVAKITVVATPEPSSVLLMLVGSGLIAPHLIRRNTKPQGASPGCRSHQFSSSCL